MNRSKLTYGLILSVLGASSVLSCVSAPEESAQAGGNGTDSNTHWLGRCAEDQDCEGDLECVCGVCSARCDESDSCAALGTDAQCVMALCEEDSTRETGLCTRGCDDDSECPSDGSCEQGVCVPKSASLPDEPGESSNTGESSSTGESSNTEGESASEPPDETTGSEGETTSTGAEPTPLPCAAMDITELNLPCNSVVLYFWDGEGCRPLATCNCDGAACAEMFETEQDCTDAYAECQVAQPDPNCEGGACDYCYELDEATCGDDPACSANFGSPVDEAAGCLLPSEFASCLPSNIGCDSALAVARDEAGRCWAFGGICYEPGFEYLSSEGDDTCSYNFPACDETPVDPPIDPNIDPNVEPPVEGCEAMDARTGDQTCDIARRYAWNGTGCESIACECQGEDCTTLHETMEACETHWAGCMDVPLCTAERVPYQVAASFSYGDAFEPPDPVLAQWTTTTWTEPFELPIEPEPCSEVEGFDGFACGAVRGLTFTEGFDEPLRLDLVLPYDAWSRIDVEVGQAIALRLTDSEFAITTGDDELPLILVGSGGVEFDGQETAGWSLWPLTVQTAEPFCKRPDVDDPDCNWLHVEQSLRISGPATTPPNAQGTRETQTLRLDPFRAAELTIGTDAGDVSYHVMHGRSMYTGNDKPNLGGCAAAFTRVDGFSVVRVVDASP